MPRFQCSSRRGSAAQSFLLLVLVVAVCFGAYLAWRKFERDRLAAEAAVAVETPVEPAKKRDYDIPDPTVIRDTPVTPVAGPSGGVVVAGQPKEPEKPVPPPFDIKEKDLEVKPVKNPAASASDLDRRTWETIRPAKKNASMQKMPFAIAITDLTRRKSLVELVKAYGEIPPEKCVEHPLAKDFPGDVPAGVKRLRTVLNLTYGQEGGWLSTGFYAPPGELITVELSAADAARGVVLQIGSHSDRMTETKREEWHRFPEVLRSFPLNTTRVTVANPFGGLVFLRNVSSVSKEAPLALRLTGVVKAPTYFAGRTTHDEWNRIRSETKGVPWGEFVGEKMVLMLPGPQLRAVVDPQKFTDFWDELVRLQDYLTDTGETRKIAERINADADISIGFMHSGYPIGIYVSSAPELTDKRAFKSDNWGINHEVGHNHQKKEWTFKGYGEVTNNLIGMYVMQTQTKLKFSELHGGANWKELAVQAIAFKDKADAFETLAYYIPVVEQFGWEPVRKVFASYHTKPSEGGEDADLKADFVLRWSVACGADLSDYSELFGFPKTHRLKYELARLKPQLKPWMPSGYPPSLSKIKRLARKKDPKFTNEDSHDPSAN